MRGVFEMSMPEYLAAPGVSSHTLKLMERSPAHCRYAIDNPKEETRAQKVGTMAHSAILEPGKPYPIALRPETYPGKGGQEKPWHRGAQFCKDWEENNPDYVTQKEIDALAQMSKNVQAHKSASAILAQGTSELSLFADWYTVGQQHGVQLKCRPDRLTGNVMAELKSCQSAAPDDFRWTICKMNYDVQAGYNLYVADLLHSYGLIQQRIENFIFIAVEYDPPYLVAVYQFDRKSLEHGQAKALSWLERYADCMKHNSWPGYSQEIQVLSLPEYELRRQSVPLLLTAE